MLLLMMELKGRFNSKMIKKAKFNEVYFDEMGGFESVEKDRITGNVRSRRVCVCSVVRFLIPFLSLIAGRGEESSHLETDARSAGSSHAFIIGEDER